MGFFSYDNKAERLNEQMFAIRTMIRNLERASKKAKQKQNTYHKKVRKAVAEGNLEESTIFAQQSIKLKHMSLRYLTLACRMEIVEQMVLSALETGKITDSLTNVINQTTDIVDPSSIIKNIENYENLFDDLSISTGVVNRTIDDTLAPSVKETNEIIDVLNLAKQENASDISEKLDMSLPTLSVVQETKISKNNF